MSRWRGWRWDGYHRDLGTYEALEQAQHEASRLVSPKARPAVFLDRDGTIIEDEGYLADPSKVRLLPGAIHALRMFREEVAKN